MAIIRNTAGQGLYIYAHDIANDEPETGDAANITATISLDGAAPGPLTDVNPTEIAGGVYWFGLTQAEANAAALALVATSTTADVQIDPVLVLTQEVGINTRAVAGDAMALTGAERTTLAMVIWNTLTTALTAAGSIGKFILDMLDAKVSSIASAVAASSSVAATDLTDMVKWVTYATTVSGLTIPVTWQRMWLTLKENAEKDIDTQAVLQVVVTNGGAVSDGVLRLEGKLPTAYPGITAASGSLAVNQGAGTVGIALSDDLTGVFSTRSGIGWDLKAERADGTTLLLSYGSVKTRATETRAH